MTTGDQILCRLQMLGLCRSEDYLCAWGSDKKHGKMYGKTLPHHISDSNRRIIETSGPSRRVYQVWEGSNVRNHQARICLWFCGVMKLLLFWFDWGKKSEAIWKQKELCHHLGIKVYDREFGVKSYLTCIFFRSFRINNNTPFPLCALFATTYSILFIHFWCL